MRLFSKYFPHEIPDKMLQVLYNSKNKADHYSKEGLIYDRFDHCADKVKAMPTDTNGKEEMKILDINNNILDFNKQNQQ